MTKICSDCKRPKANDVDWDAFEKIEDCSVSECPWGADRCWDTYECGWSDLRQAPLTLQAKKLRAGRPLTQVLHECPVKVHRLVGAGR